MFLKRPNLVFTQHFGILCFYISVLGIYPAAELKEGMGQICSFKDVVDATSESRHKRELNLCGTTMFIHSKLCLLAVQLAMNIFLGNPNFYQKRKCFEQC